MEIIYKQRSNNLNNLPVKLQFICYKAALLLYVEFVTFIYFRL